jgi:hypothetical protein
VCRHNDEVNVEFLVALLAAAASAAGILVALDQITAVARLRRQILFWSGLRTSKPLPSDAAVIRSLERDAIAKIVAFQALPAWRLLFPTFAFLTGIITAWQTGYTAGRVPATDFSWDKFQDVALDQELEPTFLVLLPFILSMGIFGWINVFVERSRLRKAYLDGKDLKLKEFSSGGGQWPASAVLGWRGCLQVFVCSVGAACNTAAFGAATGMRDVDAPLPWPSWMAILFMGGAFALMAGLFVYLKVEHEIKTPWIHPRPSHRRVGRLPIEPRNSFTGSSSMKERRRY